MELELLEQPPPRGTFAKLQPLSSAFAATVDDPKRALESALLFRFSTLSVGDAVSFAGDDGAVHEHAVTQRSARNQLGNAWEMKERWRDKEGRRRPSARGGQQTKTNLWHWRSRQKKKSRKNW